MSVAITSLFSLPEKAQSATGINEQLNYQARLLDSAGAVVADGLYNIEYKIYQDGTGCVSGGSPPCSGTLKWTETRIQTNRVTVKNGYFSVNLGSVTAFGTSVDWNQDTLWLSINVGGTANTPTPTWDGEMTPFRRMAAVPYALNAKQLGGLDASAFVKLAPTAVQVDSGSLSSIFINKTNASGSILELQKSGADVFAVGNDGATTITSSSANSFTVGRNGTTNPAFVVDDSTASSATGVKITSKAAAAGVTITTLSSGTDEALSIDAKGAGALNLNGTATGDIAIGGGSGSTGCTITNSTGALACTAGLTGTQLTSTVSTGTAPLVVASTTNVANLNASSLNGATFASPGSIGSGTPGSGAFTTLTSSGATTLGTGSSLTNTFGSGASSINTIGAVTTPGALTLHGATTLDNTFTVSGSNLTTLGGNLTVTGTAWTATPTISGLITATSGVSVAAGQSYTGAGAVTLSSGGANALTLDTGGAAAINIGSTTNATSVSICNSANCDTINIGTNADADTITIGDSTDTALKFGKFTTANGVLYISATDGTVSETAASTGAQCLQTAGSGTAPIWGSCGGTTPTLQTAYDAGNTITTTTARDIAFTLADVASPTKFSITQQDPGGTSALYLNNANASGTNTNGIFVEQTGAGTLTNGVNITQTSGALTNGLTFSGTFTKLINSTNFNVTNAGAVTAVGVNSGSGQIQGTGGISVSGSATLAGTAGNTVTLGNTTGAVTINSGGTSAWTNTSGTLTIQTATSGNTVIDSAGALQLGITNSTSTSLGKSGTTLTVNPTAWTATPTISGLITATSGLTSTGIIQVDTLGATNTVATLCRNSSNQLAACSSTGTGVAFVQGGNSLGATAILGTNDSNSLTFETNNVTQATIAVGGAALFKNSTDSTAAFSIQNNAGTSNVLSADTTNSRVGINKATPSFTLDVSGIIATNNRYLINSTSASAGNIGKAAIVGSTGVTANDVVILNSSNEAVTTTTARDTRVFAVATSTASATSNITFIIGGNYSVNYDTGGPTPAAGDQLVTTTVAGKVTVDNSATTGIIGYATAAGSAGLVSLSVRPVAGQYTPTFSGLVTATSGLTSNGTSTFNTNTNLVFNGTEKATLTSDLAGSVNLFEITATPSSTAGTTSGYYVEQANSANTNGLDDAILVQNNDTDLAITNGLIFRNNGGGGYTNFINTASGTFKVDGSGIVTAAGLISPSLDAASGTLTIGNSTATTVSICNSINCDTINIGTNGDADTITIGDSTDTALKFGKFTVANGVLYVSATDGTVSETAASTGAQCLQTAGSGTAPIWGSCGGGGSTLQTAYDAGNTITTTNARNISITLANTATDQVFEITQAGTALAFSVNDDGTFTDSSPFVVDDAGKVGIGTGAPSVKLHVVDSTIANGTEGSLLLLDGGTDGTLGPMQLEFGVSPSATGSSRYAWISAGDNAALRDLALNAYSGLFGEVGIGTTSPDALFNVDLAANNQVLFAATAPSTIDMLSITNSGQASATSGVDGIGLAFSSSNASGDAIHITPAFAGGATDALTYNGIELQAFSPTNAAGTDTVNGIKIGALTDPGASIASSAITVGSGWDTILSGTTAGTNIFSFTNASLTSAGALTVTSCSGCGGGGATLQTAYDAGNTITTTNARDIEITLANTATDQSFEITQAGTAIAFRVNDDGTFTDTTAFVVNDAGKVGIGTTAPGQDLNLVTTTAWGGIKIQGGTASSGIGMQFQNDGGYDWEFNVGGSTHSSIANKFSIYDADVGADRLVIDTSGRVGIGTTSPATNSKLNVVTASAGFAPYAGSTLTLESNTEQFLSILTSGNAPSGILFGNNVTGNTAVGIIANNSTNLNGLEFRTGGNNTVLTLNSAGAAIFDNTTDGTSGFVINDADGGTPIFNVDTTNERVGVGLASPTYTFQVQGVDVVQYQLFSASVGNPGDSRNLSFTLGAPVGNDNFNLGVTSGAGNTRLIYSTEGGANRQAFVVSDTGSATDTYFGFSATQDSGATWNPTLVGKQNGNVGIGDNTPEAQLTVKALSTASMRTFEVQNSGGVSIESINTSSGDAYNNLVTNPSFEQNINGWVAKGTPTGSTPLWDNTASNALYGTATLKLSGDATGDGASYPVPMATGSSYSATFWAKTSSGTATFIIGRVENSGDVETSCSNASVTTTWTQFTCSFTAGTMNQATSALYFKQNAAGTPTIFVDGVTLVKSASALSFINPANNLQLDADVSNLTINSGQDADVQSWRNNAVAMPNNLRAATSVTANGYAYYVGGTTAQGTGGGPVSTVYYSKINSDGSMGSWTTTTALPTALYGHSSVVANGYIYVVGGCTDVEDNAACNTVSSANYYAKLNSDGTVGTWQTGTALPQARGYGSMVVNNGFAYFSGGTGSAIAPQSTVYSGRLNANGDITGWTTTSVTALSSARVGHTSMMVNGKLYVIGGCTDAGGQCSTPIATVEYSTPNNSGTLPAWTATTSLPTATGFHTTALLNGYIFNMGGRQGGSPVASVIYSKTNASGALGIWSTSANPLPDIRQQSTSLFVNSYLYNMGGYNNTTTLPLTAFIASGARVSIFGGLDLVGLTSQSIADYGGGGTLTAGNTRVSGDLRVDGFADLNNGLSVDSVINLNAVSAIAGQNLFNINNSSSNSIFSVRHMGTNFGSLVSGGAFEGKNSYFGEEFNTGKLTNCTVPSTAGNGINRYARGDKGNSASTTACTAAGASIASGELSLSHVLGAAAGNCIGASQNAVNGIERLTATSTATAASTANCVENMTFNATTSNKIYAAANLPVVTMKLKAQTLLASSNNARVNVGMVSSDSANTLGVNSPANSIYFTNCSTWNNAAAPTGCSNTTWYGVSSGASSATVVTCSVGSGSLTAQFSYLRIEVRSTTDIHFYADYNTSDGIVESECGTGVTATATASAMTAWMQTMFLTNTANTTVLDIDYFRSWQDDNIPAQAEAPEGTSNVEEVVSEPPVSVEGAESSFDANSVLSGFMSQTDTDAVSANAEALGRIDTGYLTASGGIVTPQLTANNISTNSIDSATGSDINLNLSDQGKIKINNSTGDEVGSIDELGNATFKGTITADKIKANQIEGLDIFVDNISKLSDANNPSGTTEPTQNTDNTVTQQPNSNGGMNIEAATVSLDLSVNGTLFANGALKVTGPAEFLSTSVFYKLATFIDKTIFRNDVNFEGDVNIGGKIVASDNSAGTVEIEPGQTTANVVFTKPYDKEPVINVTPVGIINPKYGIVDITKQGFTIQIDPAQPDKLKFNWIAVQNNI